MIEQAAGVVSFWINEEESTFSQIEVEYIMKKFIQIGDVMFDPNLVQSVRRRYATCCIVEFENGAWLLVEESFKNVCEAIRKTVE